jgi:glycosyltransferase involved in cell wall biosynthesis
VLIEAANQIGFQLKVIGTGRDEEYLHSIAGETVSFHKNITDEKFKEIYSKAKAFLFASVDEEFGIAPVEAMGHGLPVIAYASGGLKETVENGKTGYLYDKLDKESLIEKIHQIESLSDEKYREICQYSRKKAENFTFEKFKERVTNFVTKHAGVTRS